jgi:hypothetical protein
MPISIRVDPKTERLIERLARTRRQTKSDVIREAIGALVQKTSKPNTAGSLYESVQDLLGCAKGGPIDLSVRTGEQFRRLIAQKRARRP